MTLTAKKSLGALLFIIIVLFAYQDSVYSLFKLWFNSDISNYNHGPLILILVLYLCFSRLKKNDFQIYFSFNTLAIISTLLFSLLWLAFKLGNIEVGIQLSFFCVCISIFLALFGFKQCRYYFIPLLLLIFTISIWDHINHYLKWISSLGVKQALNATDISFILEGFHITLVNGQFHIDDGCSGLNQFISSMTIAGIFCYINNVRLFYSICFISVAISLAIIGNIIRIFIIILSGYYTDMQHYFITTDHVSLGWVIFTLLILAYILLGNRILDTWSNIMATPMAPEEHIYYTAKNNTLPYFLLVLTLAISGPVSAYVLKRNTADYQLKSVDLPKCIDEWCQTQQATHLNVGSVFIGQEQSSTYWYRYNKQNIRIDIFQYTKQEQGQEAINEKNKLYLKKHWRFMKDLSTKKTSDSLFIPKSFLLESNASQEVILSTWYHVNGHHINRPLRAKLANIIGILKNEPEMSVIILTADVPSAGHETFSQVKRFIHTLTALWK